MKRIKETPKALSNIIEQIVEAFDNALTYDKEAEDWLKDGGEITFKMDIERTIVITKKRGKDE